MHKRLPETRSVLVLPAAVISVLVLVSCQLGAPESTPAPAVQQTPLQLDEVIDDHESPDEENQHQALTARLSEISGDVRKRQPGEDEFSEAENGLILQVQGQLRTVDKSRVRLDLSTGSIIRLGESTIFKLEGLDEETEDPLTRLQLEAGKLWVILKGGQIEIETPSGLAAVRGSYMSVQVDPQSGEVTITCLEGNCALENEAGNVELVAGQAAVISNINVPPKVELMTEEDVEEWLFFNPEATIVIAPMEATVKALASAALDKNEEETGDETPTPTETDGEAALPAGGAAAPPKPPTSTLVIHTSTFPVIPTHTYTHTPTKTPDKSATVPAGTIPTKPVNTVKPPPYPSFTFTPIHSITPTQTLATSHETTFTKVAGPNGIVITEIANCYHEYSAAVNDIDGISWVGVQFFVGSANATPGYHTLNIVSGTTTWKNVLSIDAPAGAYVYWRFIAEDGPGNETVSTTWNYLDNYGGCP